MNQLTEMNDPAGQEHEQEHLRAMGKWRFILIRGIIGFGGTLFISLALSNLPDDWRAAHRFHESVFGHLFRSWVTGFCISAFFGAIVGLLAWRRIVSDYWPGSKPDPESSFTRLGPLKR